MPFLTSINFYNLIDRHKTKRIEGSEAEKQRKRVNMLDEHNKSGHASSVKWSSSDYITDDWFVPE